MKTMKKKKKEWAFFSAENKSTQFSQTKNASGLSMRYFVTTTATSCFAKTFYYCFSFYFTWLFLLFFFIFLLLFIVGSSIPLDLWVIRFFYFDTVILVHLINFHVQRSNEAKLLSIVLCSMSCLCQQFAKP